MVEAPRIFAQFAQRAHEETFGAAGVEKRSSLREHGDEEFRGVAEEPREIAPVVAVRPVAFDAVLEVIGVEPLAWDRDGRAQLSSRAERG